jgi:2-phosphoglycerate kinase
MVILIGGVSCSGKTLMAQKLLEKYKIPYLSIDHIKMGLIRGNKYCDFKAMDSDDSITEKIWPIIKGIIMTNIENEQNIIIEGCYIPPDHIRDFEPDYLKHIISFYIGFSKSYLEKNFISGIVEHRSEIEQKNYDDYMNLENFLKMHISQKERCLQHKAKLFEIQDNYDEEIKQVYEWVDEQILLLES